jgi:N4-(beta-N-acetylglucosaminyl)-L-asparaginase
MSINRRKFLNRSILSSFALSLGIISCKDENAKSTDVAEASLTNSEPKYPITIATWDNRGATEAAMKELLAGKRALDGVEAGARIPEANPKDTSVGYGGFPDRDGNVTLDACIMDEKGNAGAVTFLQGIKHPISVARKVMEETPHVMLSGQGALDFAIAQGFEQEEMMTETAEKAWKKWLEKKEYKPKINSERHDTIGILAIDQNGDISGACTTSGMAFKMHGRVGDSPIIGAGMYVDNEVGGAAATGLGEYVMTTLGSFLIVELMRQGMTPQEACEEAVRRIVKKYEHTGEPFQVGYIALNKQGDHGAYSIQKGFNYALYHKENEAFEADYFNKEKK